MRIYIYGCSASGKSTLARELSRRLGIPHFELDDLKYVKKFSVQRPAEERKALLHELLQQHDSWIVEGTYLSWTHEAIASADVFVELHARRPVMVWRVLKRGVMRKLRGAADESLRGWWVLARYILHEYPKKYPQRKERMRSMVQGDWVELRSKRDVEAFVRRISGAPP